MESLNNEAYFSIDEGSPLSIDPETIKLTECVATRLDAWPSADYASAHDSDRQE